MNQAEYEACKDAILATFPELREHASRYHVKGDDDGATRDAQIERRKACLMPHAAADVRQAIAEYATSADVPWNEYGRQGQGFAMIGERARQIAKARINAESAVSEVERSKQPLARKKRGSGGTSGAGDLVPRSFRDDVDDLLKAKGRGDVRCAADVRAWLARNDDPQDRDRRDEFTCPLCRDTGLVTCVTSLTQRERGGETWIAWTTGVAACSSKSCIQGDRFADRKDENARLPKYDETEMVRLADPSFAQLEDVLAAIAETRKKNEAKHRHGFLDDFNNRNAADLREREREAEFV